MINRLLTFLRSPTDHFASDAYVEGPIPQRRSTGGRALFVLLAVDLGLAFLLAGLIGLIAESGLVDMDNHAVADALAEYSVWQLMLIAVIGTPLLEELIFRLPLRFQTNPIAGIARLVSPRTNPETDVLLAADRRASWDKYFPYIFYGLTAAFAFVHLLNYGDWTMGLLLVSPLLVAPQFVMGALAGFLRVRFGFWWAYGLHAGHNLVLVGFALGGTGIVL